MLLRADLRHCARLQCLPPKFTAGGQGMAQRRPACPGTAGTCCQIFHEAAASTVPSLTGMLMDDIGTGPAACLHVGDAHSAAHTRPSQPLMLVRQTGTSVFSLLDVFSPTSSGSARNGMGLRLGLRAARYGGAGLAPLATFRAG